MYGRVENLAGAGRSSDGDTFGLSVVRVMGRWMAMGGAVAHAWILAGGVSVDQIVIGALKSAIGDNLERCDLYTP